MKQQLSPAGGFHNLVYAFKILISVGPLNLIRSMLRKNTCKTCALGMGGQKGGMRNEKGRFPEVCKKSLQAMKSDMQGKIPSAVFKKNSIEALASLSSREVEYLGRIAKPLYATKDDTHLKEISWEEAYKKIVSKMQKTDPKRSFFYFSGRSSMEAGFLLQIMARVYGTNHVNNCSFYCHQASGVGLTKSIGSSTATLSLDDLEKSDLIFLIGANPTSNHPRLLTTIMHLKKRGGKVIVINPMKEPGLVRFKIPSSIKSIIFGTDIADEYIQPHIGGDMALLSGIAKYLIEENLVDTQYVENYTEGSNDYFKYIKELSWDEISKQSGVEKSEILKISKMYSESKNAVFAWAMGITHHIHGTENVQSIVNLALMRGMVGRPNSGLLPLRGHSNVQGMGTIGVTPNLKAKVFEKLTELGFKLPEFKGYDTMNCMEAAKRNEIDLAYCLGGNLFASNPDSTYASMAMNQIGMIVYMNTTLNQGHFYGRGKETLILPVLARDEESQKTTQESMFSYVRLSNGGPKRIKGINSEVEIVSEIASRLFGDTPIKWSEMKNYQNIRNLIASTVPGLSELKGIDKTNKEFVIKNRIFHEPIFLTDSKKAKFATHPLPDVENKKDLKLMTVRSEGQFNTVVFEEEDAFRKVKKRDVILMNEEDINSFNLKANQVVTVKSATGRLDKITVLPFDIKKGNAVMYYPEANYLISRKVDPSALTPSFKAIDIEIVV
jgi:molybdopterin-dependent oxidoreductase alpha subunit